MTFPRNDSRTPNARDNARPALQPPFRILLTSSGSGRRQRLAASLKHALETTGLGGEVICVDTVRLSPGLYRFDAGYCVPPVADAGYRDAVEQIIRRHRINLVIPTADHDLPYWARARKEFAERRIRVLVSEASSIDVCLNKTAINRLLQLHQVPVPRTWARSRIGRGCFPVICKPVLGSGTRDTFVVRNLREWALVKSRLSNYLVQRYLEGPEYTVDMLCDLAGRPLLAIPRERLATRAGISDTGITVRDPSITDLAVKICRLLPFAGPINMQFIRYEGRLHFIELNPRFAGGVSGSIAAAPEGRRNLVERMLLMLAGREIKPDLQDYREGIVMMVYEEALHLPLEKLNARIDR